MVKVLDLILKYENLVKNNPTRSNQLRLSDLYLKNGQDMLAYPLIIKNLNTYPGNIHAIILLGVYYSDRHEYEKSFELLKPNVECNKLNLKLLRLYFNICKKIKNDKELVKCSNYILFIDPNDKMALECKDLTNIDEVEVDDWQIFNTTVLDNNNLVNLYKTYSSPKEFKNISKHINYQESIYNKILYLKKLKVILSAW